MPLSIRYKLVFIHIPKTAGTSVEQFFNDNGGCLFLDRKTRINGHSIQHSTYSELKDMKMIPSDYRIFTVIRHPYDRFLSDYNYYCTRLGFEGDTMDFAKYYFSTFEKFDNHNRSMTYFLTVDGKIQKEIEIIRIENLSWELYQKFGIRLIKKMNVSRKIQKILPQEVKDFVYEQWKEDFDNFNFTI